jgi:hypothetical protein
MRREAVRREAVRREATVRRSHQQPTATLTRILVR